MPPKAARAAHSATSDQVLLLAATILRGQPGALKQWNAAKAARAKGKDWHDRRLRSPCCGQPRTPHWPSLTPIRVKEIEMRMDSISYEQGIAQQTQPPGSTYGGCTCQARLKHRGEYQRRQTNGLATERSCPYFEISGKTRVQMLHTLLDVR